MDFSKVIGNTGVCSLIAAHIKSKTLSHAYIIEGPKGSGKHTLAKEIAKALSCEDPTPDLPCGACRSCTRIEDGLDTDIYFLNKGDKASISVESVREMTDTLGYYPDDGDYKVYIIEEAEKMTAQAQNALLLSLEEPPSYVVFLLLTDDSTSLLETVRSRALKLKTEIFSTEFTAQWLKAHPKCKNATEEQIADACAVGRGSLGMALATLSEKNSQSASISKNASQLVELLCKGTPSEAIIFASSLKYSRSEFEQFFEYTLFAVRDLIAMKSGSRTTTYYSNLEAVEALASRVKIAKLAAIYDALVLAKDDITKNNAHIYAVMTTLAAGVV